MDKDFLLSTKTASELFHNYAEKMPVIDYHCHINPREIAENRKFDNITQVWLGGDHYKWRLMRSAGVDEKYITGDASDKEKFMHWAKTLSRAIGNPLYHWSHLELQRFFGYDGVLNEKTAEKVWNLCNEKLASHDMRVRDLIKKSNVTVICTTDDPVDSLEWHKVLAEDNTFETKVFPAWRPDKAMNIEKDEFSGYISKLGLLCKKEIKSFADLKDALSQRMDFFASMKCCVSDHALEYVYYLPASEEEIENIFRKKMNNEKLTEDETVKYKTMFMLFCGKEYAKRGWVMQLHYGAKRDNNYKQFSKSGPDTGYDCINNFAPSSNIADFLNALEAEQSLPKTIIYSLNPNDNQAIDTILGCFQSSEVTGKIQHGSAWWFNDHKTGMRDQLISLGNLGYLAGFVGMLTDSRSFLSYPRHEYFRRILCDLFGELVENGEYPCDIETLGQIVSDISYNNAVNYFDFF